MMINDGATTHRYCPHGNGDDDGEPRGFHGNPAGVETDVTRGRKINDTMKTHIYIVMLLSLSIQRLKRIRQQRLSAYSLTGH